MKPKMMTIPVTTAIAFTIPFWWPFAEGFLAGVLSILALLWVF
jgi:hypothetical protein